MDIKKGQEYFENFTFQFVPESLADGDLELVLKSMTGYDPIKCWIPQYNFEMIHQCSKEYIGRIHLRVGLTDSLKDYGGHIGYEVTENFRGNRYSSRACRLLFPLCRQLQLQPIVLTCAPDNLPSNKTILSIGGQLYASKIVQTENDVLRMTNIYHVYL